MSTYAGLASTLEEIIDAAIEWDMRQRGYSGNVSDGFDNHGSGGAYTVPPPGAPNAGQFMDGWEVVTIDGGWLPRRDVYERWRKSVNDAFEQWAGLPEPQDFVQQVASLGVCVSKLAADADVESSGVTGGNDDLTLIGNMQIELGGFNGVAMNAFTRNYASRLDEVVRGQFCVASVLAITLLGEKTIWEEAREDVARVADGALEAMRSGAPDDTAAFLKVLGAAASAVALFASGGTYAPVLAGGATALGILNGFLPKEPAQTQAEVLFGGDSPDDVYEKLLQALAALNNRIRDEEGYIASCLYSTHAEMENNEENYDLGARPNIVRQTDVDRIATDDERRIEADLRTLRDMATHDLPTIAGAVEEAQLLLGESAAVTPWQRPPGLGLGPTGPYDDWVEVKHRLFAVQGRTASTLREVADVLRIVADSFGQTDQEVSAALAHRLHELRSADPRLPQPS